MNFWTLNFSGFRVSPFGVVDVLWVEINPIQRTHLRTIRFPSVTLVCSMCTAVLWSRDHGLETRVHSSSFCPGLGLMMAKVSVLVLRPKNVLTTTLVHAWAAQPGAVGDNVPPLLGPAGYTGYREGRSTENDLCFYSKYVFIQYCTSDWISTPLTLLDTSLPS